MAGSIKCTLAEVLIQGGNVAVVKSESVIQMLADAERSAKPGC